MRAAHWVIVSPDTPAERMIPVGARLVVGRECVGVAPEMRLRVDDPTVSRNHLELRVVPGQGATATDLSTNGTLLRGERLPRGKPVPIGDGDVIQLGAVRIVFRVVEGGRSGERLLRSTMNAVGAGDLTLVENDPLSALTDRQLEILALIAQGHSNASIAERLDVSRRTVEAHVRSIMLELGLQEGGELNRRVQAVLTYLRSRGARETA